MLSSPNLRIIEIDLDHTSYQSGHIPSAIFWSRLNTTNESDFRVQFDRLKLEHLMGKSGITKDTTIVIYSGSFAGASFLFWYLKIWGHEDVKILNGSRQKWMAEGRELTVEIPKITASTYTASEPNFNWRVSLVEVQKAINHSQYVLVDARTVQEYNGEWFWFTDQPAQEGERSGHIPGAVHIGFELALNDDATFKSREELSLLYSSKGVTSEKEIITYCTVGARSSFTWFVLKYLLGYPHVRNYDGSWNEWGRLPNSAIEI
ncbi:sulfurtransferase [Merismopedia glauca CCAP 1448/3]|uniref:Sulfurtransferase n=1 Tax=Merismopedia glauca CCAP 1448/3 TaxID=1296344 RepID=A0A2T1C0A2_9CYAN|nr:sulfurtransferase [Merismopedia glauca CCAP 1448/3]